MSATILLILSALFGTAIALVAVDVSLSVWVYRCNPRQKRRFWPGAGMFMAWKSIWRLVDYRARLLTIYSLTNSFPMAKAHFDDFRACISVVRKLSNFMPKIQPTKTEQVSTDNKP